MKRLIALLTSTVALAACSNPIAPEARTDEAQRDAQAALAKASRFTPTASGKLGLN